jgi:hypothetical protein
MYPVEYPTPDVGTPSSARDGPNDRDVTASGCTDT